MHKGSREYYATANIKIIFLIMSLGTPEPETIPEESTRPKQPKKRRDRGKEMTIKNCQVLHV